MPTPPANLAHQLALGDLPAETSQQLFWRLIGPLLHFYRQIPFSFGIFVVVSIKP